MAPMSTTPNLSVALRYARSSNAVLLRLRTRTFMERGPALDWISCFPDEEEVLYPPLTYLRPVSGRVYEHRIGDGEGTITVVQVEPIMA